MSELWDLYNTERKKIEITISRGDPIPKGYYHLDISAWIMNSHGQFLLSQRHSDKSYPLYWECTGGAVISGESSLAGAVREIKEELGITVNTANATLLYSIRREDIQDFYDVWLFYADADISEMKLQETEVSNVKWVSKRELLTMYNNKELHPLIDYIEYIISEK